MNTTETTTTETTWEPLQAFQYLCDVADSQIRKGKTFDETLRHLGVYYNQQLTKDQRTVTMVTTYSRNDIFPSTTMLGADWITFVIGKFSTDWKFETYFSKMKVPNPYQQFHPRSMQALALLFMAFQSIKEDPKKGARFRRQQVISGIIFIVIGFILFGGSTVATIALFDAGWLVSLTFAGIFAGLYMVGFGIREQFMLGIKLRKYTS